MRTAACSHQRRTPLRTVVRKRVVSKRVTPKGAPQGVKAAALKGPASAKAGAKGAGESGTIGSIPAVLNAVVDALSPFGVRHIDGPATPEKVWRAIQQ